MQFLFADPPHVLNGWKAVDQAVVLMKCLDRYAMYLRCYDVFFM